MLIFVLHYVHTVASHHFSKLRIIFKFVDYNPMYRDNRSGLIINQFSITSKKKKIESQIKTAFYHNPK